MTWRLAIACSLVLAGCGGCEDPEEPYVLRPHVEGLVTDEPYYVAAGSELVIEVKLRDDAGNLQDAEVEWFVEPEAWLGPKGPEWTAEKAEPGVHRLRITPHAAYRRTYVMLRVYFGTESLPEAFDTPSARVIGYGGEPHEVLGYQPVIRMAPGERRAAHAFTLASYPGGSDPTVRVSGDDATTYAIDNSAVASVDADGIVTAIASGTASLVVTHGAVSQTVPIEVTAGTLAPPGSELAIVPRSLAGTTQTEWARLDTSPEGTTLVVDSGGYPHMIFHARKAQASSVVVASWTGTGFGFETVSRAYEQVGEGSLRLAIDDNDRLYVVYRDGVDPGFVLAERPARGGPAEWTYRRLDIDHPAIEGVDTRPAWQSHVNLQRDIITTLPRSGGGMWIAYRVIHGIAGSVGACSELVRLAEVTPSQITYRDVRHERYEATSRLECAYDRNVPYLDPLALVAGSGAVVDVVTTLPSNDAAGLVRLRAAGDRWTSEKLLPERDDQLDNYFGLPHDLRKVAIARAREPGQVERIFAAYCTRATSTSNGSLLIVEVGNPSGRWFLGANHNPCESVHAFQTGPYLYLGSAAPGRFVRTWPFGDARPDNALDAFADYPFEQSLEYARMEAVAVTGDLLVQRIDRTLFTVPLPPAPAEPTGDELEGLRLGSEIRTPIVTTRPLVRGDGRRFVLSDSVKYVSDTISGALMTSSGPGQPWTVVDRRTDDAELEFLGQIWEIPGALFAQRAILAGGNPSFARSLDGGATWEAWGSIGIAQPVRAQLVTPAGQAFVVLDAGNVDHEIFFAPAVHTSPSFTSLGGLPSALAATHRVIDNQEPVHGIATSATEAYVVTTVVESISSKRQLLVQRFALLDGTATGHYLVDLGTGWELHPELAVADGQGVVYVPYWTPGHLVYERKLAVIDPVAGTVTTETLATDAHLDVQLARLADGRVAAAYSESAPAHRRRVVVRMRETTGWSAPKAVRAGGRAQSLDAIAAEPDGGLLVVMADNVGMASDLANADRVIVRVPAL